MAMVRYILNISMFFLIQINNNNNGDGKIYKHFNIFFIQINNDKNDDSKTFEYLNIFNLD